MAKRKVESGIMCSSRGQIQYAFTFILFIIIAGFLAVIGYDAITGTAESSCDVEVIRFTNTISSLFDRYDDFQSLHRETLRLPCNYDEICFVDSDVTNSSWTSGRHLVISTAATTDTNIFLLGSGFVSPAGYSEKIEVNDTSDELCVKGSTVSLVFEGRGRKTLVKEDS